MLSIWIWGPNQTRHVEILVRNPFGKTFISWPYQNLQFPGKMPLTMSLKNSARSHLWDRERELGINKPPNAALNTLRLFIYPQEHPCQITRHGLWHLKHLKKCSLKVKHGLAFLYNCLLMFHFLWSRLKTKGGFKNIQS